MNGGAPGPRPGPTGGGSRPWSRRRRWLGPALELVALGCAVAVDLWATRLLASPLGLPIAVAAAVLALTRYRLLRVEVAAAVATAASLAYTALYVVVGLRLWDPDPDIPLALSVAEQLALALLIVAVLRRCDRRPAAALVVAAGAAIVLASALRGGGFSAAVALSAIGAAGAVLVGLVLRRVRRPPTGAPGSAWDLRLLRRNLGLIGELAGLGFWFLVDLVGAAAVGSPLNVVAGLVTAALAVGRRWVLGPARALAAALTFSLAYSLLVSLSAPVFALSFTEQLALAVLVVAVLRHTGLATALPLALAAAVPLTVAVLLRGGDSGLAVVSALGWGGAVAIGLGLRELDTRRRAALEDVRSAERMELARELHAVVAHHVTGIVAAARAAGEVARRTPEQTGQALTAIETAGLEALTAMRSMVGVLRGAGGAADDEGARTPGAELADVRTMIDRFDRDAGLVRLIADPELERAALPAGVAATGYRVVQEALTNVRRHAPDATSVEVEIRLWQRALLLAVRNDGLRPTPVPPGPGGFGLVGMAERVAALNGNLSAGPTAPGVWTVAARLPLEGAG